MKLYDLIKEESINTGTIPVSVVVEPLYEEEVEFLYYHEGFADEWYVHRYGTRYYRVVGQRTVIEIQRCRICSIVYDVYRASYNNYAPYNVIKCNGEIETVMDADTTLEESLVEDGIAVDEDGERLWKTLHSKSGKLTGVSVLLKECFSEYELDTLDAFEHPTGKFYNGSAFGVVPRFDMLNEFVGKFPTYTSGMNRDAGVDPNLLLEIKETAPDYYNWWVDWKRIQKQAKGGSRTLV